MLKQIISSALALSLAFGAAAYLPEGFSAQSAITARAEDTLTYGDYQYTVLDDGTVEITDYNGSDTEITIPSKINGKSVKIIGNSAFSHCEKLKTLRISKGVKNIGDFAFNYCSSIKTVTIPTSVNSIGEMAFHFCNSLSSLTVPKNVKKIGFLAFYVQNENFTIKTPKGSAAAKFAKKNDIKVKYI